MPESEVRIWYTVGSVHVFEVPSSYEALEDIRYRLRKRGIKWREQLRRLQ